MPVQPLGPTGLLAQSLTLPAGSQSMAMGGMGLRAQGMDGRKKGMGSHWLSIIGNATENGGAGIAVDGAGNVLVSGLSNSTVLTLKLNADGEPQWANTFSAALVYIPDAPASTRMSAATDPAGNLYIVGGQPGVTPALYAAKFGATGSVQLQRSSNGNGFDGALGRRVAISSGGNIYVAGEMISFTGGTYRSALVKFNPTGGIDWARLIQYGSGLPGDLCGVSLDASENAYVCCASGVSYIAKINASGTVLFQRIISDVSANAVAATPSGQFYVVGYNLSPARTNAVIICYDTAGNRLWSRSLGASTNNTFGSVAVDAAGNAYACGYTDVQGPGGANVLIAKYSAAGSLMWQRIIGSTGNDYGVGIAVSGSDVYFTGQTSLGAGSGDVLTGKIPDDGSKTGVVGGLSYLPSTLPDAAWTYSDASSSAATTTITPNNTAAAYTTAAAILTNSTGRL
jgi:hypothetical protein